MAGGAHMGFAVSAALTRETLDAITGVRQDPTRKRHAEALADVVLKLTDAGLEAYYLRPLEKIGLNTLLLSSARLGIRTSRQAISVLARKIIHALSPEQLLAIADTLDEMLIRSPDPNAP